VLFKKIAGLVFVEIHVGSLRVRGE